MKDQIFVSHSKDDEELLHELDKVFGKVGLKQYRASFEDQEPPVSQELKDQINDSVAMFVVLGRRAQSQTHTMIWIGWEAGVAIQAGIPVWILEDIQSKVEEPIPSFTDYVLWDSRDDDQKRVLRDLIENKFVRGDSQEPSGNFTLEKATTGIQIPGQNRYRRNTASVSESEVSEVFLGVRCPYESCGEEYTIRFVGPNGFNCPSCRKAVKIRDQDDSRDTNSQESGDVSFHF
jgi:hypothetical protein